VSGMRYAFELYDEGSHIVNFGDGMKFAPYGLNGGHQGSLNKGVFLHTEKPVIMESKEAPRRVAKGDQVILNSSGGGGWGNPLDRPAEKVYDDVLDEIITIKTAVDIYGVVITEEGIDYDKTNKLRNGKKLCKN